MRPRCRKKAPVRFRAKRAATGRQVVAAAIPSGVGIIVSALILDGVAQTVTGILSALLYLVLLERQVRRTTVK